MLSEPSEIEVWVSDKKSLTVRLSVGLTWFWNMRPAASTTTDSEWTAFVCTIGLASLAMLLNSPVRMRL